MVVWWLRCRKHAECMCMPEVPKQGKDGKEITERLSPTGGACFLSLSRSSLSLLGYQCQDPLRGAVSFFLYFSLSPSLMKKIKETNKKAKICHVSESLLTLFLNQEDSSHHPTPDYLPPTFYLRGSKTTSSRHALTLAAI